MENGKECGVIVMSEFKVKLGSVSMYCRKHKTDMIFIDNRRAICPHCLSEKYDISMEESHEMIEWAKAKSE